MVATLSSLVVGQKVTLHSADDTTVTFHGTVSRFSAGDALVIFEGEGFPSWSWPMTNDDGVRAYWFSPNDVDAYGIEPEVETPAEPAPCGHDAAIAAYTEEIERLRTRNTELLSQWQGDVVKMAEYLKAVAIRRDYCHEFEQEVREMGEGMARFGDLLIETASRRERDFSVRVEGHQYVTVEASSEEEACEIVSNDPSSYLDRYSFEVDSVEADGD